MGNLIASINAVLPIGILLILGFGLKRLKVIDIRASKTLNSLSFKVFLPVLLFNTVYTTDLSSAINLKLIGFAVASILVVFIGLCLLIPLFEKDNKKRGVLVQGMLRSNVGVFGLPIAFALCEDGNVGPVPVMIAIAIPIYSALSIVALEIFRGQKLDIMRIIRAVVTNPLIIGAIFGLTFSAFSIPLPVAIADVVSDVSGLATPLALIVLGASFNFTELKAYRKQIFIGLSTKLIVLPLIFLPISVLLGFRGVDLISLLIIFAAPTAVSTYTVAEQMEGDSVLAGQLVVLGSIIAIPTIFCIIFVLKQLMLI